MSGADKTIESLKKINDFPFYTATYYGNYKINEYADGAIKKPNEVVPFFEALLEELGKPAKLNFPQPLKSGYGCSAFYTHGIDNSAILGKNLDWKKTPVLLLKTRPKYGYSSLTVSDLTACDIFQLGSLEYSLLLSPYVPFDGINEKGLIVTMLSVQEGGEYPEDDGRLPVGDFNIIRIILDTCQNIDEALAAFENYNIMQTAFLPVHYLIADKNESCIVEFFNGKMHTLREKDKNYLTNFLKLKSSDYKTNRSACRRYQKLESELNRYGEISPAEAKQLLKTVSVFTDGFQVPSTIWSMIYIQAELCIKIKIGNEQKYYSVRLQGEK